MTDFLELTGLNRRRIRNMAVVYTGLARALEKEHDEERLFRIANNYAIAASYMLLLDPAKARNLFFKAAEFYSMIGNPIWMIYGICSNNHKGILSKSEKENMPMTEEIRFYLQLRGYFLDIERGNNQNYIDEVEYKPISGRIKRIGIPYNLVVALLNLSPRTEAPVREALHLFSEFVKRCYEIVELKRSDRYHWSNLLGNVVPVEPVGFAVATLFLKSWTVKSSYEEWVYSLELDPNEKALLDLSADILDLGRMTNR